MFLKKLQVYDELWLVSQGFFLSRIFVSRYKSLKLLGSTEICLHSVWPLYAYAMGKKIWAAFFPTFKQDRAPESLILVRTRSAFLCLMS